jgi:transposase InsO family protein
VVDTSIVNVALTDIQAALGASLTEVSWVVSSYAVANVIILPMAAWLGPAVRQEAIFHLRATDPNVGAAIRMAARKRRPEESSDEELRQLLEQMEALRSIEYRQRLEALGVTVSMSRKGNCWDNAVAESFFATLKTELIHRRRWRNALEVRTALFEYIEVFYTRRRLHSSLDYRTPAAVEQEHLDAA